MNPDLVAKIESALDANGGSILWADFIPTLNEREKFVLHDHLRALKKQGVAQRKLRNVEGVQTLFIERVTGGDA